MTLMGKKGLLELNCIFSLNSNCSSLVAQSITVILDYTVQYSTVKCVRVFFPFILDVRLVG